MKALLVDGLNLVRRIHAAVPKDSKSDTPAPLADTIASCTASLQRALSQHRPTHCLTVFDHSGKNWRHELFPDYKKNRAPMPEPLRGNLSQFEQAFATIGVECYSLAGFEADDVIATVAIKIAEREGTALILSTDRNYCQLLSANIKVFDHFGQRYLDADMIEQRFQVTPQQLPDLLALAGDSSLSIPGIKTIGIRTAAKLMGSYGNLEKIIEASADSSATLGGTSGKKLAGKIRNGMADARLAKTLFTLKTDIDLGINLNQLRYQSPN